MSQQHSHISISLPCKDLSASMAFFEGLGIPEVIPPEACYLGWQESLVLLANLVEAKIHK